MIILELGNWIDREELHIISIMKFLVVMLSNFDGCDISGSHI